MTAVHQLQGDRDRQSDARIPAVVKVIAVIIVDVNVIGLIPVFCPVFRPGIHEQERKAAVLEAGISHEYRGAAPDAEPMCASEIDTETVLRDVVTAIAAALGPGAMLVLPMLGTILLPGTMSLPAALLHPTFLLLPGACLLLSTLRRLLRALLLLRRLGALLRLGLLGALLLLRRLSVLLLLRRLGALLLWRLLGALLLLRLLGALLLVRLLPVRLLPVRILLTLLLLGLLGVLLRLLALLPFRLILPLVLLVVLCVSGSNAPEYQNQCRHPDEGNGFHLK